MDANAVIDESVQAERRPGGGVAFVQTLAAAAAIGVMVATSSADRWHSPMLLVITGFAIMSDLTSVETGGTKLKVSGSFLGIMLAAVVLGGAPAALAGSMTIAVGWFRWREAPHYLVNNLVTYLWFPLLGGLFFHALATLLGLGKDDLGYYLLVFVAFMVALVLNFLGVAGYQSYLDRTSLWRTAKDTWAPLLSAQLFSALLTIAAVYVAVRLGTIGLALFALVLVIFQYLVGELLVSKRRSERLHRLATTDELTGLANRESFRQRLTREIEDAGPERRPFAVMMMDLDRFKEINDTLGHHYGDALLGELGPRLERSVAPTGLVARFGGDEFAILPGRWTDDPEELEELATPLLQTVQQSFVVDELSLEVGASIGIARFPEDGTDPNALLRRADVAMYAAKESDSGCKVYAAEQDHHSVQRLGALSDFRRGLETEELVVHYQPIVDLDEFRVRGAEGLVRWQHPEHGLLAPGAFIHAVEQTGLIGPLTRYVLERSIAQCADWRRQGRELDVAVNLSVRNLLDRNLPREIERLLDAYSLPPDALQLEITERMIMSDPERALTIVSRLSDLGVRLSVDDYGTGYSSLANLRRLPIDELKIDRSFVTPMLKDESDLIIVRSTINLAHDLGLKIIAEGVEDEPTLEHLSLLGCDLAQGFHLSRPLAADAFADWVIAAEDPIGNAEAA
jgi:diguanylate cyclase (GGDEF)-like protein